MQELGKKDEIFGADKLVKLNIIERPNKMPKLKENESLICGYDQGLGERMIVCSNLEEMQELYDAYALGSAIFINWYTGHDVGFILTH